MSDFEYTKLHKSMGIGEEPEEVLWTARFLNDSKKDTGSWGKSNNIGYGSMNDFPPYHQGMKSGYMTVLRHMDKDVGFIFVSIPQIIDLFKRIQQRREIVRRKGESLPREISVKDKFIWRSASCEEVIKWNVRPHRFIIDLDAEDVDVPDLFENIFENITDFDKKHKEVISTIQKSRVKEFNKANPNALKMLSSVVIATRESLKVMKQLYGLVGGDIFGCKIDVDESIIIRATHYDAAGNFIRDPEKWSFHLVFKNVIMTNNKMACVFGCLIRVFLLAWHFGLELDLHRLEICDVPKSYAEIVEFVHTWVKDKNEEYEPEARMSRREELERKLRSISVENRIEIMDELAAMGDSDDDEDDIEVSSTFDGLAEEYEDYFVRDMEHSGHIIPRRIQKVIDMGLYQTSHNLRIPLCTKPDQERYSEIITKGHKEIDAMSSTYIYNDMNVQEYVFLDDEEYDDSDVADGSNKKMSKVLMDDNFVRGAIDKALTKFDNFDFRSQTPQKDGSLIINFNRLEPDTECCTLCKSKKPHERDNNLFMTISANESGTRFANMYCIKAEERGANRPKLCIAVSGGSQAGDMEERIKKSLEMSEKDKYNVLFDPTDYVGELDDNFTRCVYEDKKGISPYVFDESTVTYIVAGMGIGKTVTLIDYIKKFPKKKIIMLSNRIALTNEVISKMNKALPTPEEHFTSYQDTKDRISDFNRLVIQTESLNRLTTEAIAKEDFLLILDESESIIKQFSSSTHRDNLNKNILVFMFLIYKAKNIIALDATMTMATHNVIKAVMEDYKRKNVKYTFYRNEYKTQNKMTFNMTTSRNSWLSKLMDCVRNGKKCVVALNSKNTARSLKIALESEFKTSIEIGHYDSETLASVKRRHFSNVNKYWKEYDVLLYTPTAGAGISFEEKHYDYLFGYFVGASCDAEACIQLLGRVRDISKREAYIYVDPAKCNVKTTKEAILNARMASHARDLTAGMLEPDRINIDGFMEYRMTPKLELQLTNIATKNRSRKDLFDRIVRILHIYCDNVKLYVPDPKMKSYEFSVFIEKNKIEMAEAIHDAPCITPKDFNDIKNRSMTGDDISHQERRSIDKFMLSSIYNVEQSAQDFEFILKYNSDKEKEQCSNLCAIPNTGDLTESLELMSTIKRINALNKTKDLGNMLLDYTTASKIDVVTDVVQLLTTIGVTNIKKAKDINLATYKDLHEEIFDICEVITKKIENRTLDRLLGHRLFADKFVESFGKFLKELLKLIFGMTVTLSTDSSWITIYRRLDYEYQKDIHDRAKSTEPRPKVMTSNFLVSTYYSDLIFEPSEFDGLADDSEEYSIGQLGDINNYVHSLSDVYEEYDNEIYRNCRGSKTFAGLVEAY